MRILWSSNAVHSPSGYGVQGRYLLPRLMEMGHEVAIFSWYGTEGGIVDIPVAHPRTGKTYMLRHYPRFFDPIGNDVVLAHANHWQADLVVTLVDSWVLNSEVHAQLAAEGRWAQWSPVDHDIIPPAVLERYRIPGTKVLPYSRFAERLMHEAGIPNVTYLPHGVEAETYRPFTHVGSEYNPAEARAFAKRQLGFDPEHFLIGMVGANKGWPPRKGFPEAYDIVNQFRQRHPGTRFYVHAHTSQAMGGVDLVQLGMEKGVSDIVRYPDQYAHQLGLDDKFMALIYNAFDVMIQPSYGEGFGLPLIESQASGCPVIVNDCTAMTELAGPGWRVKPATKWYDAPQHANWHLPSVPGFVDALEEAYARKDDYSLRDEARAFAMQYDWEVVAQHYWKPWLDREAERRGLPRPDASREDVPATDPPTSGEELRGGGAPSDGACDVRCHHCGVACAYALPHDKMEPGWHSDGAGHSWQSYKGEQVSYYTDAPKDFTNDLGLAQDRVAAWTRAQAGHDPNCGVEWVDGAAEFGCTCGRGATSGAPVDSTAESLKAAALIKRNLTTLPDGLENILEAGRTEVANSTA